MTSHLRALAADDRELIQQLLEDINIIESQFLFGVPMPSAARSTVAPILRRWLAEGLFYKAQKLVLPKTITFLVHSNGHSAKLCKAGVYEHWMELVLFRGIGVSSSLVAAKFLGKDGRPTIDLDRSNNIKPMPQKASTFFNQNMFFWKGEFHSRIEIIKMHANTLGGVHFDFKKAHSEKHIIEIKNYLGYEVSGDNIQMLVGEDINTGRADAARRPKIYDATELVLIDTALIFANGIRESEKIFTALL